MIPTIGCVTAKQLIAYCGGAEAVFHEKANVLEKIPNIGRKTAKEIVSQNVLSAAEFELRFMEENGIHPVYFQNDHYPFRLKQCSDAPVLLYQKGNCNLNTKKVVSIVGTRASTDYGESWCEEFVKNLAHHDVLLVSGLAYGIDVCAHHSAIDHGIPTVGVLGHGLDTMYPAKHRKIAQEMIENGAILSEFVSGTKPSRENFPRRNRLVAGMCDALVVVEAKKSGGALITAKLANDYNRDVFALPGNLHQNSSAGCNKLIKSNQANLIESIEDLEYIMNWEKDDTGKQNSGQQMELFINLNTDEENVLNGMSHQPESIDLISLRLKMPISKVIQILLTLELKGLIKNLPGNLYKRI
ncbi:MAG: DNA-processing protein DprA [Flavobacteriales bacterium]|jgi:DNA processing protein|nr:DNA-processing protein DprA [Flavobacteriales bacterium]